MYFRVLCILLVALLLVPLTVSAATSNYPIKDTTVTIPIDKYWDVTTKFNYSLATSEEKQTFERYDGDLIAYSPDGDCFIGVCVWQENYYGSIDFAQYSKEQMISAVEKYISYGSGGSPKWESVVKHGNKKYLCGSYPSEDKVVNFQYITMCDSTLYVIDISFLGSYADYGKISDFLTGIPSSSTFSYSNSSKNSSNTTHGKYTKWSDYSYLSAPVPNGILFDISALSYLQLILVIVAAAVIQHVAFSMFRNVHDRAFPDDGPTPNSKVASSTLWGGVFVVFLMYATKQWNLLNGYALLIVLAFVALSEIIGSILPLLLTIVSPIISSKERYMEKNARWVQHMPPREFLKEDFLSCIMFATGIVSTVVLIINAYYNYIRFL